MPNGRLRDGVASCLDRPRAEWARPRRLVEAPATPMGPRRCSCSGDRSAGDVRTLPTRSRPHRRYPARGVGAPPPHPHQPLRLGGRGPATVLASAGRCRIRVRADPHGRTTGGWPPQGRFDPRVLRHHPRSTTSSPMSARQPKPGVHRAVRYSEANANLLAILAEETRGAWAQRAAWSRPTLRLRSRPAPRERATRGRSHVGAGGGWELCRPADAACHPPDRALHRGHVARDSRTVRARSRARRRHPARRVGVPQRRPVRDRRYVVPPAARSPRRMAASGTACAPRGHRVGPPTAEGPSRRSGRGPRARVVLSSAWRSAPRSTRRAGRRPR